MDKMEKRLLKAYEQAITTRGRNKGLLKAKCPKMGTDGAVMWNALAMYANPYKVGLGHIMYASMTDQEFYQACEQFAQDRAKIAKRLDRDRIALERLGAW